MTVSKKTKYIKIIINAPKVLLPQKPVFLISHMRSYSSLLSHILLSNNEIMGLGEALQNQVNYMDLIKLQIKAATVSGKLRPIVFDKILNDQYVVAPQFLKKYKVKTIFTVRQPVPTVNSIHRMYHQYSDYSISIDQIVEYYVQRNKTICDLYASTNQMDLETIAFKAEDVLLKTTALLDSLKQFLQLNKPLSEKYEINEFTGKINHGDPSEAIKSGKIIRDKGPEEQLSLSRDLVNRIESSYEETLECFRMTGNYLE